MFEPNPAPSVEVAYSVKCLCLTRSSDEMETLHYMEV